MIEKQLLQIREYRHQKAERVLAQAHRALAVEKERLAKARSNLESFIPRHKQMVADLYQKLLYKKITLRKLEETRLTEAKLNERLAGLKADIETTKEKIKEKQDKVEKAKQALAIAQKQLNKAEEIISLKQEEIKKKQMSRENAILDEFRTIKKLLPALCCLVFIFSVPASILAKVEEETFYRAINQNLPLLLEDIAARFNLTLKIENIPNRRVNGEYAIHHLPQFLDKLTQQHKLDWFISKKILYILPRRSRVMRAFDFASARQMEGFYHHLKQKSKIMINLFPHKRLADEAKLVFTAPEVFLRLLATERKDYLNGVFDRAKAVENKKSHVMSHAKTGYGIMIFHLENAWAADKEYQFADNVYSVPGVASIVRGLTGAGGEAKQQSAPAPPRGSLSALTPLAAERRTQQAPQASGQNQAKRSGNQDENPQMTVLADERLNAVLVHDSYEKYDYYKELIHHLDKASSLVEIEAMIVDVAKNHISDLGISWRGTQGKASAGFGEVGESLTQGSIGFAFGLGGLATALSTNLNGLLAKINFLETRGDSRIISRPSVTTMDNLEAVINTTQRFYVRVEGYQDSSLYPVEAGTTLKVTPHIIRSSNPKLPPQIRLFVTIEDGAIDTSENAAVDNLPSVQENKVKTQAVVEQGESLLIGGHIHTTRSESTSRVPILGYIPLIGYLFSTRNSTERKFIRLFIIKPRVYK